MRKAYWVPLAHVNELKDGEYIKVPWFDPGEEVVLLKTGTSHFAFENRCPHRGAKLVNGRFHGRLDDGIIRCQYHGRRFELGSLRAFPVALFGDWVCVQYRPADSVFSGEMRPTFGGVRVPWAEVLLKPSGRAICSDRDDRPLDHDWAVAVENALDWEHVAHVHAGSFGSLGLSRIWASTHNDGSSAEFFRKGDEGPRLDIKLGKLFQGVLRESPDWDYAHVHLFPFAALSSVRGTTVSLQLYLPLPEGKTFFVSRLYTSSFKDSVAKSARDVFLDHVQMLNTRIFMEDIEVCDTVRAGGGKLGPSDARIAHFRAHVAADNNVTTTR